MIYLKCTIAGLLAVLAAAFLMVVVVTVCLSIASRSSETGSVGWDPISLARPLTWLVATLGIFLIGILFGSFFESGQVALPGPQRGVGDARADTD